MLGDFRTDSTGTQGTGLPRLLVSEVNTSRIGIERFNILIRSAGQSSTLQYDGFAPTGSRSVLGSMGRAQRMPSRSGYLHSMANHSICLGRAISERRFVDKFRLDSIPYESVDTASFGNGPTRHVCRPSPKVLQMRRRTGYFEALQLVSVGDIQLTKQGMVSDAVTVNEDTSQSEDQASDLRV